jgi:hypothetical protein
MKVSKRKGKKFGPLNPIQNGDAFTMKSGRTCKVTNYIKANQIEVEFDDGYKVTLRYGTLRGGTFVHPMDRTVMKVGYIGIGKFSYKKDRVAYRKWRGVLERAYDNNFHKRKVGFGYRGTLAVKEWHNFQNFAEWFYQQEYRDGWEIDKDVRSGEISIYSPSTCILVPKNINMAFQNNTGVCYLENCQRNKKYQANISIKNVKKTIGYYKTESEAISAYRLEKYCYIVTLLAEEIMSDKHRNRILEAINVKYCGVNYQS